MVFLSKICIFLSKIGIFGQKLGFLVKNLDRKFRHGKITKSYAAIYSILRSKIMHGCLQVLLCRLGLYTLQTPRPEAPISVRSVAQKEKRYSTNWWVALSELGCFEKFRRDQKFGTPLTICSRNYLQSVFTHVVLRHFTIF